MSEDRTLFDRISNGVFAIPAVAQWWAKATSRRTQKLVNVSGRIPFAKLERPLSGCTAALVTTAGVHLRGQVPFDMLNPDGDASFRQIPGNSRSHDLVITHKYYDHSDADKDLNVVFPLERFRELASQGVIGQMAQHHYAFMGHIDGAQVSVLNQVTAREVAARLRADGVDFAFLTPA